MAGFFLAAALLVQALGRVVADASEDWDSGGPAGPGVSEQAKIEELQSALRMALQAIKR